MQNTNARKGSPRLANRTQRMALIGVLTGIIILMAFTPLGYLKTFGVEISFIMVPVVIGAITLGPSGGAVLGGIFGITSFIQCFGISPFGSALLGINPIFTFILCIVPRILAGWIPGLIYKGLSRVDKTKIISFGTASLSGALVNTLLFMAGTILFFWQSDYIQGMSKALGAANIFTFFLAFVGINGLVEAIACLVLGTVISKALIAMMKKRQA